MGELVTTALFFRFLSAPTFTVVLDASLREFECEMVSSVNARAFGTHLFLIHDRRHPDLVGRVSAVVAQPVNAW
ncbi:hypothetical protein [Streptomyces sp. bgisy126]|uniref:hypothetical protein n=1 Tax=unclassified Streptomyces TaxID=2593676 RepID=UPI003EBE2FCA